VPGVRRAIRGAVLGVLLGAVALLMPAAPAAADIKTVTVRQGPITLKPYEVRYTSKKTKEVRAPGMDGFIIAMHARMVDLKGNPMPVQRIMLHHIVYKDVGSHLGERTDPVCGGRAQSFYGTGEENESLQFPPNYGYRIHKHDKWWTGWMLMNHKNRTESAYIEYTATIDTSSNLADVTPYWVRVTGCDSARDPIFTVPGGGAPGSHYYLSSTINVPKPGLLIAAGSHAHGGVHAMTLTQPNCGDRPLFVSKPTYGMPDNPYYHVLPVLHEPGPINMSWNQSGVGIPVGQGEPLRVVTDYDDEMPHVRAMGIMHIYIHHQVGVEPSCGSLPSDITTTGTDTPGRSDPPKIRVPLTGLNAEGKPVTISRPPGRIRHFKGNVTVKVQDFSFNLRNISIPLGATVRWRFIDSAPHNASLASGPFGFASRNSHRGASYAQRFTKPGVYRTLCTLHPVDMTQAIVVRPR
jgi:plastocyanin